MQTSTTINFMKTAKYLLVAGVAMALLDLKVAFSQDTSTNQPPSTPDDSSASMVSPSDILPTPTIAPATSLVLVQQSAVMQPDTGTISLQQTTTTVSPVSGSTTNSNPVQGQN
jgi:hypothetical protein